MTDCPGVRHARQCLRRIICAEHTGICRILYLCMRFLPTGKRRIIGFMNRLHTAYGPIRSAWLRAGALLLWTAVPLLCMAGCGRDRIRHDGSDARLREMKKF